MSGNINHHYYVTFSFLTNKGQIAHFSMDMALDTNKLTLSKQKEIKSACEQNFRLKNGGISYENFALTSISYLGEMTQEEYNS